MTETELQNAIEANQAERDALEDALAVARLAVNREEAAQNEDDTDEAALLATIAHLWERNPSLLLAAAAQMLASMAKSIQEASGVA